MYRVQTVFTGVGGSPAYNSLYWSDTATTAQEVYDATYAFWQTARNLMSASCTIDVQGTIQQIAPATGQIQDEITVTDGATFNGAMTGVLPTMSQGLLRLRTETFRGGRRVRGRINVPYPGINADNGAGAPTTAAQGFMASAAALIIPGAPDLVIYSRPRPPAPGTEGPTAPGAISTVTSASTWNKWAVLRSRRD